MKLKIFFLKIKNNTLSIGYATATTMEDKEIILQMNRTKRKMQIKVKSIFQSVIKMAAAETNTDLPPLKLNQQGNT